MADIKFIDKNTRRTIKKLGTSVIPNVGDIVRFANDPESVWEVKICEIEYFNEFDPSVICVIQKKDR